MPRYKYVGKEPQNLAGVGHIKPGDIFAVTHEQAIQLEKRAPEQFILVAEDVEVQRKTSRPSGAVVVAADPVKAAVVAAETAPKK